MGERLFRELTAFGDKQAAARDAAEWGFPREIDPEEVKGSFWFRMGEKLVFWFERVPGYSDLWLHLIVAPGHRYRWPVFDWIEVSQSSAIEKGASRLRYQPFGDSRDGKIPEYLMRIGWTVDGPGLCKELGVLNG